MSQELTRTALLLSPQSLFETNILVQALRILRRNGLVDYEKMDIDSHELKKLFPDLPKEVVTAFTALGTTAIEKAKREIRQRYTIQKSGIPYESYFRSAFIRHYHGLFDKLRPFAGLVKWYHTRRLAGQKNYVTAPCVFSNYRPQLHFEVRVGADGGLDLMTMVDINGTSYEIGLFARRHFFLESNNEYFLLSFRQYQVLEWLEKQDVAQYAFKPADLAQHILSELDKDFTVKRNQIITADEISVQPVNRVVLSELNNTFLMLTPQWSYDGYVVDGPWKEKAEFVQQGITTIVKRDKEAEQNFVEMLEALHPDFPRQRNGYYYLSFANAQKKQWFLKTYHYLLTSGIDLLGIDMLRHFRYSPHPIETEIRVLEESGSRQVLSIKLSFGKEKISLREMQKMLLAGQRAVLLKDGSLGVPGDAWFREYATLIKHGKVEQDTITIASWLNISLGNTGNSADENDAVKSKRKDWWQRWETWQRGEVKVYEIPSTVQGQLRPYQQKGYEWMMLLADAGAGGCLADDMGLGKTLQSICFLAAQVERSPGAKHIIICPSSLVYNWQQELLKFAPAINTLIYHGSQRKALQLEDDSIQLVITTYGTLRADGDRLLSHSYCVAIIDESHNIKNPSAQITKAVSNVQSMYCIALSGTPVVNNTFDLYSQLNVVLPGMFGSREFFKREYADPIDRFGDEEKIVLLQKLTAPFVLRRTKEQVATDLPAKTETMLWCEMPSLQRELYESIREQVKSSLFLGIKQQGLAKTRLAVIQGILKLRQVCNSPLLLPEEEQTCNESVKTDILIAELKNIGAGHKALVFSQFSSMLDLLAAECTKQGLRFYHFDGQTPAAKRMEMVNAFQEQENDVPVFLISLKAGNTGLNLTAADYVFLFDPWWNTAVQQQAIDRTHRIGQNKNVFAYKMICKDTIEEKIILLQQKKKQLADDLISADEGFVKALSEEDIAYLFT